MTRPCRATGRARALIFCAVFQRPLRKIRHEVDALGLTLKAPEALTRLLATEGESAAAPDTPFADDTTAFAALPAGQQAVTIRTTPRIVHKATATHGLRLNYKPHRTAVPLAPHGRSQGRAQTYGHPRVRERTFELQVPAALSYMHLDSII